MSYKHFWIVFIATFLAAASLVQIKAVKDECTVWKSEHISYQVNFLVIIPILKLKEGPWQYMASVPFDYSEPGSSGPESPCIGYDDIRYEYNVGFPVPYYTGVEVRNPELTPPLIINPLDNFNRNLNTYGILPDAIITAIISAAIAGAAHYVNQRRRIQANSIATRVTIGYLLLLLGSMPLAGYGLLAGIYILDDFFNRHSEFDVMIGILALLSFASGVVGVTYSLRKLHTRSNS